MKIRTLTVAGAVVSAVLALSIAVTLVVSVLDVRESNTLAKAADELTRDIWQLRLVIVNTVIGGDDPPLEEWRNKRQALRQLVNSDALSSSQAGAIVDRLRSDDAGLDILYSTLATTKSRSVQSMTDADRADQRARTAQALLASSQSMFDDAFQIVRESQERIDAAQYRALVLFLTLLAMIAAMAFGMWRFVRQRVLAPLVDLQRGTERVAAGALDHRVGVARRDEIGALSSSFDQMTRQLQTARSSLEREIAERKFAAEHLREAEASLRATIDSVIDYAIMTLDSEGRVTSWNAGAQRIKGYEAREIVGAHYSRFFPAEDIENGLPGRCLDLAAADGRSEHEGWRVRKDGSSFWAHMVITAVRDEAGQLRNFTKVTRDLSAQREIADAARRLNEELERRVTERTTELEAALGELRASERHYRMLFEANPHPMWVYDFETLQFLAVNDAAVQQYRYTREEFLTMTLLDIRPPEDRHDFLAALQTTNPATSNIGHHRHQRKDGEVIEVEAVADGIEFLGRKARLVLANNITARRQVERQIQTLTANLERMVQDRTSQLEAANKELEAFSYSVSHDLRAPLRHIDGFADLLREQCASSLDQTGRRYLDVISDSVRRMGQLIDDLLSFSRMGRVEMHKTQVSMNHLVQEALKELTDETESRTIEWDIEPLPETPGDRALLKQVWLNVLSNAIKYTRSRSQAKIRIGCNRIDGMSEFSVRDNGVGFNMKYADKLFGVFQRLHRADEFEGTGVGLANVRRIVARHGGETRAEGKVDEGATVYFTLPD